MSYGMSRLAAFGSWALTFFVTDRTICYGMRRRTTRRKVLGDPKIAVAILRVSTEKQELGPEAQRGAISAWAERESISVVEWFVEQGVSGATPVLERVTLLAALEALPKWNAGVLAFAKRDRIARNVAFAQEIERLVYLQGAAVRTADGMSDGRGSSGLMSKGFHDLLGAYEREVIRERTRDAMAVKKARGERAGTIPYGFRLAEDGRRLEKDEIEQGTIVRARVLRTDGLSFHEIARRLLAEGYRPRVGDRWFAPQVARMMLKNGAV